MTKNPDKLVAIIEGEEIEFAFCIPGEVIKSPNGLKFPTVTDFYNFALCKWHEKRGYEYSDAQKKIVWNAYF